MQEFVDSPKLPSCENPCRFTWSKMCPPPPTTSRPNGKIYRNVFSFIYYKAGKKIQLHFLILEKLLKQDTNILCQDRQCRLLLRFVDGANWHVTVIPYLLGSHGSTWSSSMQMSQILHFQTILQNELTWPLDLHLWTLTLWTCEGSYIISIIQVWFQSDFIFSYEVNFTFWAHLTTWPLMTFDLGIPLAAWTYKEFHIVLITQVWF